MVGDYFEWSGSAATMVKYYYAGGQRVAMRTGNGTATDRLTYLLSDHLGSTTLRVDGVNGSKLTELRYKAWGENRYASGTTPTSYRYTGQREDSYTELIQMGARWYDPLTSRWTQPDTDVPESQDGRGLDRYAYVANNPIVYQDPSGHCWGVASGIRGVPSYDTTCNNLDMALSIVQHPEASFAQKAGAGAYIAGEAIAHVGLVVGAAGVACGAMAGCAAAAEAALGIGSARAMDVSSRLGQNVWNLNPFDRGWTIENAIGRGSLLKNLPGFPTIDRFTNGIATSIKSMDLGAKSYQNIQSLTSTVEGYVTELANFKGDYYGGVRITNAMINGRQLILAIPVNASKEQLVSISTRKCSTHIHPHCASNLRQQCATFATGWRANQ